MKLLQIQSILLATMSALFGAHARNSSEPEGVASPVPDSAPSVAPPRLKVVDGKEVTFYPTYGYKDATGWNMHLRGWVHENRHHANKVLEALSKCRESEMNIFRSRTADILDDDKTFEKVSFKFDGDDKTHQFSRSRFDGIIKLHLVLTNEQVAQLQSKQQSSNSWLTYRALGEYTGLGRIRLIPPDPNGISLISDIDDTIKITEVPAGADVVLRNTLCLDFKPVLQPDMAARYRALGNIPVHYISGGPEQLYGPLYDYLITGDGRFPEGTFHLKFFPKTALSLETPRNLIKFLISSLDLTFDHKLREITSLMERFPERKFILVGDSGEIDPEVYNEVRKRRPAQVKEIWIRDVLNDDVVNHHRLEGMTVIPVNPPICIEDQHFEHLEEKMSEIYPTRPYKRNEAPPCGP